jgi:hypothetical protein
MIRDEEGCISKRNSITFKEIRNAIEKKYFHNSVGFDVNHYFLAPAEFFAESFTQNVISQFESFCDELIKIIIENMDWLQNVKFDSVLAKEMYVYHFTVKKNDGDPIFGIFDGSEQVQLNEFKDQIARPNAKLLVNNNKIRNESDEKTNQVEMTKGVNNNSYEKRRPRREEVEKSKLNTMIKDIEEDRLVCEKDLILAKLKEMEAELKRLTMMEEEEEPVK